MVQLAQKATSEPAAQKVLSEATVQKVASEPIGPFEPHPKRQVLTTVDAAPATPVGPQSAVEPKDDEVPFEATVRSWQVGVTRIPPIAAVDVGLDAKGWTTLVHDCRSFVASEWATKAATLGWDARQLFGCHRVRPWILNWWGALWFIQGGEILAMTEATISLKNIRGVRQSIRRPAITGYDFIVPVWDVSSRWSTEL
jgi:hypothetical protein